jgi:hypothetical protein
VDGIQIVARSMGRSTTICNPSITVGMTGGIHATVKELYRSMERAFMSDAFVSSIPSLHFQDIPMFNHSVPMVSDSLEHLPPKLLGISF